MITNKEYNGNINLLLKKKTGGIPMKLKCVNVENYRNFDGVKMDFMPTVNYIVGENNIGKSNLLLGLNKIFSGKNFCIEDYINRNNPIKFSFTLSLNENEIGIFDELVDPDNTYDINIVAVQNNADEYIHYSHLETGQPISLSIIKNINLINYDSLRNPKNEIDFSKTRGAGTFLNYKVNSFIENNGDSKTYLNKASIRQLEKYTKTLLSKITVFNRFGITPKIEEDAQKMLSRILILKDGNNVSIAETGYGVQFNMLLILSILEKIIDFAKKKDDTDEVVFSALLVFDEPEIHLHPYLQRTIIKDMLSIAEGHNEKFNELIKELFGIDKFEGQIIIATHSPNIIESDYTKIIRMFNKNNKVNVISGSQLGLNFQHQKQLAMQFEYVKEAVFSRAIIIVEGDSEYGSFKQFSLI